MDDYSAFYCAVYLLMVGGNYKVTVMGKAVGLEVRDGGGG